MGFSSVKNLVASVAYATPVQFDDWRKAWRAAANNGSAEPLLGVFARERGVGGGAFFPKLGRTLGGAAAGVYRPRARRGRGRFSPKAGANARLAIFGFAQAHDSAGGAEQNFHEDRVSVFHPAHGRERWRIASGRKRSIRCRDDECCAVRRAD